MNNLSTEVITFGILMILALFSTTALPMFLHYRKVKKEFEEGKITEEQANFRLWNG